MRLSLSSTRIRGLLSGIFLLFAIAAASCVILHPDDDDPKSLQYLLWRDGFYRTADLDRVTDALIRDPERDDFVRGKTIDQIRKRVGYLTPLQKARPYLRWCFSDGRYRDVDVYFIRQHDLAVIFVRDRGVKTFLVKGC